MYQSIYIKKSTFLKFKIFNSGDIMKFDKRYNQKKVFRAIDFTVIILMLSSLILPAISTMSFAQTRTETDVIPEWYSEQIFKGTKAIDGCAIGDCYPDHSGNEVIFCNREYELWMGYRDGNKWTTTKLWAGLGQPLTPAIGDFDPDHEGNEILIVGMRAGMEDDGGEGDAIEVYYDTATKTWESEVIFENSKMLHGCAIGDIDPRTEGDEIVVVGFAYNTTLLKKVGSNWKSELMWTDTNNVRKAVIDDFDSDHDGNELVVVSKSGKVAMIYWNGSAWKTTVLWTDPDGLARCAVGDGDPDHAGKEIVVGSDSGKVYLVRGSGTTWESVLLFTDTDKNRGVWVGDVDPLHDGEEIIAYGYSAKATEITGSGDTWETKAIWTDSARGHEIRIGEFDSTHTGNEILLVGYSNNATMVGYNYADFSMTPDEDTKNIPSGGQVVFNLEVKLIEGFDRNVSFELVTESALIKSYKFEPTSILPDGDVKFKINLLPTASSDPINLKVIGSGGGIDHVINLKLNVQGDTTAPEVNINLPGGADKDVELDSNFTFTFDKDMDRSSVESGFSISPNITGAFVWEDDTKFTFIPSTDLEPGTTYQVTISQDVEDSLGNTLGEDKTFSFTTAEKEEDDEDGDTTLMYIIVIIVIIVIILVIALMMRKKQK
jgi:hypothetical protein